MGFEDFQANTAPVRDLLHEDLRVVDSRSVIIDMAPGAAVAPLSRRPVIHLVLRGEVIFQMSGRSDPVFARAGECILIFYGDRHQVAVRGNSGDDTVTKDLTLWHRSAIAPRTMLLGAGKITASLLSTALELSYISPSAYAHRAGPTHWVVRASGDSSQVGSGLRLDLEQVRHHCFGQGSSAFATALATLLFVHAVQNVRDTNYHPETSIFAPATRQVAAAVREIDDHFDKRWTVSSLAQNVGLSRSTFAQAFHRYIGMGPFAYLTEVRMRHAAQLLKIPAITPMEVAKRIGFDQESSFARAFKRYFGMSPRQYAAQSITGATPRKTLEIEASINL